MKKYKSEREHLAKTILKQGDYQSTKDVITRVASLCPQKNILAELDKHNNIVYYTTQDFLNEIVALGDGLIANGFENKHIAIMADNSYRYLVCDICIASGVGVVTPIDKDAPENLAQTLLFGCDADAVICSHYLVEKIKNIQKQNKRLKNIITIDKKVSGTLFYDDIVAQGKNIDNKKYLDKKLDLDATAEILFTSGTTGANKGVELTQNNLAANIMNCLDTIAAQNDETNTSMSILPMHHATEINTHILPRIAACRLTYINDCMKNMMKNIKIFKPYVITIVPMIANAFYKNIMTNVKKLGKEEKLKKGIKLCKLASKFGIDLTHKLFKDVFVPFGGNLNQIVCGGAPLNCEVVKGMCDLGVYTINGYGITECGPLVSMNTETLTETKSIGRPCPGLQIKVYQPDENGVGELCVKGKSVAKGYYKDEESTKKVFEDDGYFHTGDLVYLDKKGRMFLSGRKKNLIILDNGKNVFPEELEHEISQALEYVKEVVIYAQPCQIRNEEKTVICAGIYIEDQNIKTNLEKIKNDFREINKNLPNYKHIAYVDIVDSEYEKTATKKIKRDLAVARHTKNKGVTI